MAKFLVRRVFVVKTLPAYFFYAIIFVVGFSSFEYRLRAGDKSADQKPIVTMKSAQRQVREQLSNFNLAAFNLCMGSFLPGDLNTISVLKERAADLEAGVRKIQNKLEEFSQLPVDLTSQRILDSKGSKLESLKERRNSLKIHRQVLNPNSSQEWVSTIANGGSGKVSSHRLKEFADVSEELEEVEKQIDQLEAEIKECLEESNCFRNSVLEKLNHGAMHSRNNLQMLSSILKYLKKENLQVLNARPTRSQFKLSLPFFLEHSKHMTTFTKQQAPEIKKAEQERKLFLEDKFLNLLKVLSSVAEINKLIFFIDHNNATESQFGGDFASVATFVIERQAEDGFEVSATNTEFFSRDGNVISLNARREYSRNTVHSITDLKRRNLLRLAQMGLWKIEIVFHQGARISEKKKSEWVDF